MEKFKKGILDILTFFIKPEDIINYPETNNNPITLTENPTIYLTIIIINIIIWIVICIIIYIFFKIFKNLWSKG